MAPARRPAGHARARPARPRRHRPRPGPADAGAGRRRRPCAPRRNPGAPHRPFLRRHRGAAAGASRRPSSVASLTLIEPVQYFASSPRPATRRLRRRDGRRGADARRRRRAATGRAPPPLFLERWGAAGGLAAMAAGAGRLHAGAHAPGRRLARSTSPAPTVAVRHADLARIACPVLLIDGGATPPVVRRHPRRDRRRGAAGRPPDRPRRRPHAAGHPPRPGRRRHPPARQLTVAPVRTPRNPATSASPVAQLQTSRAASGSSPGPSRLWLPGQR